MQTHNKKNIHYGGETKNIQNEQKNIHKWKINKFHNNKKRIHIIKIPQWKKKIIKNKTKP